MNKYSENKCIFDCKHVVEQNTFDEYANKKKLHYHEHYELFYFMGDTMTFFVSDRPIRLNGHDIILVPPQTYHGSMYPRAVKQERLIISFSPDLFDMIESGQTEEKIKEMFRRNWLRISDTKLKIKIRSTMRDISNASKSTKPTGIIRAKFLFCELLLRLLEIADYLPEENSRKFLASSEKVIHDIVGYINTNYAKKLTLDDIVSQFFISKYYLCRLFKKIIGLSIISFINTKRLSEAALLIQTTDRRISDIAEAVGFGSQAFFIKRFKEIYENTPSEYRMRFR